MSNIPARNYKTASHFLKFTANREANYFTIDKTFMAHKRGIFNFNKNKGNAVYTAYILSGISHLRQFFALAKYF